MKRWLARIGIGLAVLLTVAALLAVDYVRSFQRSLLVYDGTVQAARLTAPVTIIRDRHAIPHVEAASFADAAYGLGYAHAQDRLWQMETARRFVAGRLSELFGSQALGADTMMRAMGLYRAAEAAVDHLSPETRRVLSAYADGVNAYIAGHKGRWPIEFSLANDTPEPWKPADSIAVLKGMALQLSGNAGAEAARVELLHALTRAGVQNFVPPFSAAPLPAYLDDIYGGTQLGQASAPPDITASDNWVVNGEHSVTGKPLLANDPHLGFTIPSVWYLAHMSWPDGDVVGGTLAGIPAIIVGHNRHLAWGMTNTGPDTQDLYLERINPEDNHEYQTPEGWAAFDTELATIKVRFGADVHVTLRNTRHGPVMPDTGGYAGAAPKGYVLALAWTALNGDDTSMDTVLAMDQANSSEEFREAGKSFVSPMQNLVYADDAGHIGLALPGRVPLRTAKNDSLGIVPAPGWDPAYDWQGFIPADKFASIIDPPSGMIATANNKTVPDDYPYTLSQDWEPPYRYGRIMALLAQTSKQSVDSFKAIQTDPVDTYALALKQRLIAAAPFDGTGAEAATMIASWDGAMLANRPEPLIWAAWTRALAKRLYGDELRDDFDSYWSYRPEFTLRALDNTDGQGRWCDDRTTPQVETCPDIIRLALADAVTQLSAAYGADPKKWRWGDAHKAIHSSRPLGALPIIGPFFNREVEMSGGPYTLLRADNSMRSGRPYAAVHGAGYRGIYDLANPDASQFIISTGQSGNAFSPHYDDLLGIWAKGGYVAIPSDRNAIDAAAVNRLTLQPVKSSTVP